MRNYALLIIILLINLNILSAQKNDRSDIILSSQNQINNFATNYPGLNIVDGNLELIITDDISNLLGLNMLTGVNGDLIINGTGYANSLLSDLEGLQNITNVGGDIEILNSTSISSLNGLQNITNVGGSLKLSTCQELLNLSKLQGINTIGGHLWLTACNKVKNLSGLENLITINGDLVIDSNDSLISLQGINNLDATSIQDLRITQNELLSMCSINTICSYLATPGGSVFILDNASSCNDPATIAQECGFQLPCLPYGNYWLSTQASIDSFHINYPNCQHLMGKMNIGGPDVVNLNGLDSILSIEESLEIKYCSNLFSLNGLNQLTELGSLNISNNDQLSNLDGLDSLKIISHSLTIHENLILNDINGIAGIDASELQVLSITDNPTLMECNVQSVCNYLSFPSASSSIWSNATGCNSEIEIEEACALLSDNLILDENIKIYPNPTTGYLNITGSNRINIELINLFGQTIMQLDNPQQIDLSNFNSGIYFLLVYDEHNFLLAKEKIVKQ